MGEQLQSLTSPACRVLAESRGNVRSDSDLLKHGVEELLSVFEGKHGVQVAAIRLGTPVEGKPRVTIDVFIPTEGGGETLK